MGDRLPPVKILFLSQRVPYPPDRGDKITTWHLVERMSRSHDVTCVAFAHDDADREAADHLSHHGIPTCAIPHDERLQKFRSLPLLATRKPLTLGVYGSAALQAEVDRRAGEADLIYAFSSSMGAFFLSHPELPRVMHIAELDSDKWLQYAERVPFPMSWVYRREGRTLLQFERRVASEVNLNVLCTPLEERGGVGIEIAALPGLCGIRPPRSGRARRGARHTAATKRPGTAGRAAYGRHKAAEYGGARIRPP